MTLYGNIKYLLATSYVNIDPNILFESISLSFSSFHSEMHQGHPCLLCRAALQGHEGTSAISCIDKKGGEGKSGGGGHGCEYLHAALNEVACDDVLTGSRNHGQDPHPHHGVPFWGGHAGHQKGLFEDLWEITLHWHLSKLMFFTITCWCGAIWTNVTFTFRCQGDTSGDYKKLLLKLCGGSD